MKILTLLRHAKSGWDDPTARDFDRPLNPRGRLAARAVGREMKRLGLGYDRTLASPARRVAETIGEIEDGFGPLRAEKDERLYLASLETLLEIVRGTDDAVARLLLVGHNPGLELLALALARKGTRRGELEIKDPTATLAESALPVGSWADAAEGAGEIVRFLRPRDIDPELGPEGR